MKLTVLDMSQNSVGGTIPVRIGDLTKLRALSLSENRLTGGLPETVASLSSLARLPLHGNTISGVVPLSICRTGMVVEIECGSVDCGCCESVDGESCPTRAPTPAPSPVPTPFPTTRPSSRPSRLPTLSRVPSSTPSSSSSPTTSSAPSSSFCPGVPGPLTYNQSSSTTSSWNYIAASTCLECYQVCRDNPFSYNYFSFSLRPDNFLSCACTVDGYPSGPISIPSAQGSI